MGGVPVDVELEGVKESVSVSPGSAVEDVMAALGVTPEEYLAVLDGQVVTEKEPVPDGARLELVRVWSGG